MDSRISVLTTKDILFRNVMNLYYKYLTRGNNVEIYQNKLLINKNRTFIMQELGYIF